MTEGTKTILVVDDEEDALTFLTTVLEDNGIATDVARDGVEAMAKIEEEPPALVLLDIAMPEKSGVAVYRGIKEDDRYKEIPVIIITGISGEFEKFISSRRQVPPPEGYISKPVEPEELLEKVRALVG